MSENGPTWTVALLREHLQDAVELELFTIPAYLCAMWSVSDSDTANVIQSVVNEEMLHLELACNVLNALGGNPTLTRDAAPSYPGNIPFHKPPVAAQLQPVSLSQIGTFMTIELPTYLDPGHDTTNGPAPSYDTIGEFYNAIENGLNYISQHLSGNQKEFPGDPKRQVTRNFSEHDKQLDNPVIDLPSALAALSMIVDQGEGSQQTHYDAEGDLGHYWRFKAVMDTITNDPSWLSKNVLPMIPNPGPPGTYSARSEALLNFFDACYSDLLQQLQAGFRGNPPGISDAIDTVMFNVIDPTARYLVQQTDEQERLNLTPRFIYRPVDQAALQTAFDNLAADDQQGLMDVAAVLKLTTDV